MVQSRRSTKLVTRACFTIAEVYTPFHHAREVRLPVPVLPISLVYQWTFPYRLTILATRMPDDPTQLSDECRVFRAVWNRSPDDRFYEAIQLAGSTYLTTHTIQMMDDALDWTRLPGISDQDIMAWKTW